MGRLKADALETEQQLFSPTTLKDLLDQAVDVFCWCNRCGHNSVLRTAWLAGQMGAGLPVPEVGARLRCSGCASKDVATRPAWPSLGPVAGHVAEPAAPAPIPSPTEPRREAGANAPATAAAAA